MLSHLFQENNVISLEQNWAKGGSKLGEGEWQIGRRPKHAVWQRKQIWNVYMKEIQLMKKSRTWTMGRRASGRLAEGLNMQSDWGNKYETWLWKKSSWTNAKSRSGKSAEGQVANRPKGEKQLYSRNQWTCVSFFNWKLIALVLTISILCLGDHFQWKKFSQSAVEVQFPGYRPFVLPTHNQVSWGTWLKIHPLPYPPTYLPIFCLEFTLT